MDSIVDTSDARTPEEIGLDLLNRALSPDGAITLDEAARINRAIGWPPPQIEDGAIRAPTAEEIARWTSADPEIVDALGWPEIGAEIEYRSPAIFGALLASARRAVGVLRELAHGPYGSPSGPEVDPAWLEIEHILATGEATAAELALAHSFFGWDPPRFVCGRLQVPTINGDTVVDAPAAIESAVEAWSGKIAPMMPLRSPAEQRLLHPELADLEPTVRAPS
jgi:hypothetical protein